MTIKEYKCVECGETDLQNFYPRHKSKCKSCQIKERVIAQRLNLNYQERQAKYYRRWYAEKGRKRSFNYQDVIILWKATHQDSIKTSRLVMKAIKKGLLERRLECAICGREKCLINAHHNDYNFPYDVMWLCSSCHKKTHQQSTT